MKDRSDAAPTARPDAGAQAPSALDRNDDVPLADDARRRVLVVDDNVDAAATLAQLVQLLGHDATVAFDGLQALEATRAAMPDIVLLDLGMPRLDGIETAKRLRATPGGAALYIAAVTGWGQEADRVRTRDAGFDLHLVKPVAIDVLTELLARPRRR